MREDTNALIERLARDAKPVKPLAPPASRAAAFVAGVGAVMAMVVIFAGHTEDTIAQLAHLPFAVELAGAVLAGIGAIVAAVMLSIPGRAQAWLYLPLPGIALWLLGGGVECYRQFVQLDQAPSSVFSSGDCFAFIATVGLPTTAAAYVLLRRSLAVDVSRVAALAGLGAALLAASLLQFIHAHGTNPVDFGTHIAAVALLVLVAMTAGRFALARRA